MFNKITMQQITRLSLLFVLLTVYSSCGNTSKKEREGTLTDKKVELEKLKTQKTSTEEKIKSLELEISKLDTSAVSTDKIKLVSVIPVGVEDFKHYIDLQSKVDAENVSYVSPRGMGGQVRQVYVKKGDHVNKGQLLLKLDDAVARQNVVAMRQSMSVVETQLAMAKTIYTRQKNLWDQNIGTEVQLLQSKSNVEGLENQLKTMRENVKSAQEQVNLTNVYSDVSGVADEVNVHAGESFTGGPNGIKIVNTNSLKVITDIPENYLSRVKKGTQVQVMVPDVNKTFTSTISVISQSVSATSRGFTAEIKIPFDPALKPGQSAITKILDYSAAKSLVIPVNVIQSDETSKYVYVLEKLSNGKTVAKKKPVIIGEVYADKVEIKTGLAAGDQLINEGYQGLYEGQAIATRL
jgi:membrane fusion protein, multidrug efflux system